MSQKLAISFRNGKGEEVAVLYKRWSTYTETALVETMEIMETMQKILVYSKDSNVSDLQVILQSLFETDPDLKISEFSNTEEDYQTKVAKTMDYLRNTVHLPETTLSKLFKNNFICSEYIYISKKGMAWAKEWALSTVTMTCSIEQNKVVVNNFDVVFRTIDKELCNEKRWDVNYRTLTIPKREQPKMYYRYSILKEKDMDIVKFREYQKTIFDLMDRNIHAVIFDEGGKKGYEMIEFIY